MNDQELTTAVRQSVGGARMSVPEEQIVSRSRAIRAARRRRVAASVTAVVSAGAAAIAAAAFLPRPAAPAMQDTAYVVSHVTQALDALPAGTIMYTHITLTRNTGTITVTNTWATDSQVRYEGFNQDGQLATETGNVITHGVSTDYMINYPGKTWTRTAAAAATSPADIFTNLRVSPLGIVFHNPSQIAAWLRASVSNGTLKVDGTATVDGVTAIKLIKTAGMAGNGTLTYYVNPATYLPVRLTMTPTPGTPVLQDDFQWLPPTPANRAKLNPPAVPRGFTRVSR